MRAVALIGAAVLLSGCFHYVPIATPAAAAGSRVRIELSDVGVGTVAPVLGPNVEWVEGTVQPGQGVGLTLSLNAVQRRGEGIATWQGETVLLQPADVRDVRERRLSRARTILAASGALVAGTVGIIAIAHAKGSASGNGGGKPPPPP